jgi:hypothetical protein
MPQNSTEYFMTSIHSQKVLTMLNDRLLAAYEKYYGDLQVGKMSPEDFITTYGCIEDRVTGNLKVGVMVPKEYTSTISTNSTKAARSSKSSNDSQNVA